MMRIRYVLGFLMLVALVAGGCGGQEKENLEKFTKAQGLFETARQHVNKGKFEEANAAICQACDILHGIRRTSGPMRMGDSDLPEGPEIKGKTPKKWEEQWLAELRSFLNSNFDSYVEMASEGKLDWNRARGFLATYGDKQLDGQWVQAFADIDRARGEDAGDQYLFECESKELNNCEMIRLILTPKAAKPISTEQGLSAEGRKAAFGIIRIKVELDWKMYQRTESGDPTRGESVSIPYRVYMTFSVTTNRNRTSWDGEKKFTAEADLPAALSSSVALEIKDRTKVELQQKIEKQLSDFENQAVLQ